MPRPQNQSSIFGDDLYDSRKLSRTEAKAFSNGDLWLDPNLGVAAAALCVDVRRLARSAFIREEEISQTA